MKKSITPLNEKNQKHGYWERYWIDGQLMKKLLYINDIKVGYEEYHYFKGNVIIRFHL